MSPAGTPGTSGKDIEEITAPDFGAHSCLGLPMQETHSRSTNPDIYTIRRRARCTQEQFADALGIPANTVRSWEQRRKRPSGAARTLLRLIEQKPELLEALQTAAT
jgi:DNA-binding transcriptional regulator YiaG